jgi:hypothetical protein
MQKFLLLLMFTFPFLLIMAFIINFAKRRLRGTRHGLTGMCHKDGGAMCCSCAAALQPPAPSADRPATRPADPPR